jgi:hypothetical protein
MGGTGYLLPGLRKLSCLKNCIDKKERRAEQGGDHGFSI